MQPSTARQFNRHKVGPTCVRANSCNYELLCAVKQNTEHKVL